MSAQKAIDFVMIPAIIAYIGLTVVIVTFSMNDIAFSTALMLGLPAIGIMVIALYYLGKAEAEQKRNHPVA